MPELKQLKALQAVAEAGSFSGAADALNYTQPAVSKTIASLERELGAVLVERQCRPVVLTDAGEALVRHADEMFARLSSARSEIEAIAQVDAGNVFVGTIASAGTSFVVTALREFRRRHPGVDVSITEGSLPSSLVRRLRAGDFDLAVVFDYPAAGEDIGAGLEVHRLLEAPFDVVLPPGHRLAGRRRVRPDELAEEDWILPDFADSPFLRLVYRMCGEAGFEPRIGTKVNNCELNLAMVAAGEGVTVLPRLMLEPRHADVVVRPLAGDPPVQRVAAVRLPARYLTPATSAFLALLVEAAGESEGGAPG